MKGNLIEPWPYIFQNEFVYLTFSLPGFGTDEDTIIEILTTRSNAQRQKIAEVFKAEYDRVSSSWNLKFWETKIYFGVDLKGGFKLS